MRSGIVSDISDISQVVPVLDREVDVHPFGSGYLLQHRTLHYQVSINRTTYQLLQLVDGKRSIATLSSDYERDFHTYLSAESIHYLLYNRLALYGIVKQDEYIVEKRKRASYLKLSFILLKQAHVQAMTRYFTWLFYPKMFYLLLVSMSLLILIVILSTYTRIVESISLIFSSHFILYLAVFQIGTLFHELGHAAACRRFGASHGGIGFGFYLLTPVFFADVSDAWKLPASQRIVVNLAGVYMELIIASAMLVLHILTDQLAFLVIPCLLILSTLYNLNPLLRFDGYWVLVDATNTPNLQKKSFSILRNKLKQLLTTFRFHFIDRKEFFLFVYGAVSAGFIFFFLGSILIYDPDAILRFPNNVYELISGSEAISWDSLQSLIIPAIFWYFVLTVLWKNRRRIGIRTSKHV